MRGWELLLWFQWDGKLNKNIRNLYWCIRWNPRVWLKINRLSEAVCHNFCDLSKYLWAEIWALGSVFNMSLFTLAELIKSQMNQPTPTDGLVRFLRTFLSKHAPTFAYSHILQGMLTTNRPLKHYFLWDPRFIFDFGNRSWQKVSQWGPFNSFSWAFDHIPQSSSADRAFGHVS